MKKIIAYLVTLTIMSTSFAVDYYKLLGVARTATGPQIRAAYLQAAKKLHPDVNPGADKQMAAVNNAYQALYNPGTRAEYDAQNPVESSSFNPTASPVSDAFRKAYGDIRASENAERYRAASEERMRKQQDKEAESASKKYWDDLYERTRKQRRDKFEEEEKTRLYKKNQRDRMLREAPRIVVDINSNTPYYMKFNDSTELWEGSREVLKNKITYKFRKEFINPKTGAIFYVYFNDPLISSPLWRRKLGYENRLSLDKFGFSRLEIFNYFVYGTTTPGTLKNPGEPRTISEIIDAMNSTDTVDADYWTY